MASAHNWQFGFRDLHVIDDQEGGDQPYFVFFGFRATPGVADSSDAFWPHYLDDDWAENIKEGKDHSLPAKMGSLSFPDVTLVSAADTAAGAAPELIGYVGVAFESDATRFSSIRSAMNDVEDVILDQLRKHVEQSTFDPNAAADVISQLIDKIKDELGKNIFEAIGDFLSSFTDPDDLIAIRANIFVAGDQSLATTLPAVNLLAEGPLEEKFTGDDANYRVTGRIVLEPGPGHAMPATVELATDNKVEREKKLYRAWGLRLQRRYGGQLPAWEGGAINALRIIAAGLTVFKDDIFSKDDWALFSGLTDEDARADHLLAFQRKIHECLDTIYVFESMGTSGIAGKNGGDYDFVLVEVISLINAFEDWSDLLTNDMVRKLLVQKQTVFNELGLPEEIHAIPFAGQNTDEWLATGPNGRYYFQQDFPEPSGLPVPTLVALKGSIGETENHLLGIWAWRFLVNSYLALAATPGKDRHDPELQALVEADPERFGVGETMKDWVLQLLGRIVHSGAFETNARPYSAITLRALFAYYQSSDEKVRTAAWCALDYLAAEFSFQSFEGKRMAPIRRQFKHRVDVDFYQSDYLAGVFGVLTGAYVFSDDNGAEPSDEPIWAAPYHWENIGQMGGFALAALMSGYAVPAAIHDFMLNKHGGYFARIQTRYSRSSFPLSPANLSLAPGGFVPSDPAFARPRYFQDVSDGKTAPQDYDVAGDGAFKPVPQSYFAAPTYLNSAGGWAQAYYNDLTALIGRIIDLITLPPLIEPITWNLFIRPQIVKFLRGLLGDKLNDIDAFSRPSVIIPRGNFQVYFNDDIDGIERLLPTMRGKDDFQFSRNLATYKNFSLGYTFDPDDDDRHQDWPQRYPESWNDYPEHQFGIGRASFHVFDFTRDPQHALGGHYWVLAQFSKSRNRGRFREYGRGFWEVVPKHRFASAADLEAHVRATNPGSHFTNGKDDNYWYQLATTGEKLEIHNQFGSTATHQAILQIQDAAGNQIPIDRYIANLNDESSLRALPLLDVWQVDRDYGFTGMKYAHADGHGRVEIYNPFMGQRVTIDSSDYRSPQRFESSPTMSVELPPVAGTEGQLSAVYALALDGAVIYATHASIPEFGKPPTVAGELVELDRHDLQVRRRVGVGLEPNAVVKHEASNRLFVVNRTGISVSVFDALSFNVLATIKTAGAGLISAAVSQKFNRVYVTQPLQERILVIDPAVPKELASLTDLVVTGYVAVDETTDRLFVLVQNSANALLQDLIEFEINAEGHRELRRLTVNNQVSNASEIAVDAERCYLLTADRRTPTTQHLLEIVDRTTLTVTAQVRLPGGGIGVAVSASQRVVYVTTSAELLTFDVTSFQVVHRRTVPGSTQATIVADERTGTAYYGVVGASTITSVGMTIDGLGS